MEADHHAHEEPEWTAKFVIIPRWGILLEHGNAQRRMIWPGDYDVRHSRTFGTRIYRRAIEEDL